jgi:hypothetical protein
MPLKAGKQLSLFSFSDKSLRQSVSFVVEEVVFKDGGEDKELVG